MEKMMDKKVTVSVYVKEYIQNYLDKFNIDYDVNDILNLISYTMNIDINTLKLDKNNIYISNENLRILNKRLNMIYKDNIPLQHITKKQYFYNEEYHVTSDVLIPRPDTEILVQKAIEYIEKNNFKRLIDMCTGSGCIGISCAKNSNIEEVLMVDISKKALEVANKNIKLNNAEKKCRLLESNLFENIMDKNKKYDIIVSNPPYIRTDDINKLDESVKKEPIIALDGGNDGMFFYNKILFQAREILRENGIVVFEIGYDQLDDIKKVLSKYVEYELLECIKDYGGNDRVVVCRFRQI